MAKKSSHFRADASIVTDSIINKAKRSIGYRLNALDKRQNRNLYAAGQNFNRSGTIELFARFGGSGGGGTAVGR